jgi:hypothetical protein
MHHTQLDADSGSDQIGFCLGPTEVKGKQLKEAKLDSSGKANWRENRGRSKQCKGERSEVKRSLRGEFQTARHPQNQPPRPQYFIANCYRGTILQQPFAAAEEIAAR